MNCKLLILACILCISAIHLSGQEVGKDTTDWSKPENINPFDQNMLKTFELKLGDYITQANMLELQGDYKKAASYYLFIVRNNMGDENSLYNLARCYARLNRPSLASIFLIKAINAGFNNLDEINKDEAFDRIRNTTLFKNTSNEIANYAKQYGKTIYVEAKKMVKSRVQFPNDFNKEKEYILVVGLHGYGGSSHGFIQLSKEITNAGFIFVAPEAPYPRATRTGKAMVRYSWVSDIQDIELWKKSDHFAPDYIVNVANYMQENYKIKEVYLMGFSQGAAFAYITGIKHQDKFKGIVCIGGRLPRTDKPYSMLSEEEINTPKGLKVYIAHSPEDHAVNIKEGKNARKKLKQAGYDVEFTTYKGGHIVPDQVLKEVMKWIKTQN